MSSAYLVVGVLLAAGTAAVARAELAGVLNRPSMPWGTIAVNLLGAFALGIVAGSLDGDAAVIAGTAFLGSFTTFSSFARDLVDLGADQRRWGAAASYVGITMIGTIALAWLGLTLAA